MLFDYDVQYEYIAEIWYYMIIINEYRLNLILYFVVLVLIHDDYNTLPYYIVQYDKGDMNMYSAVVCILIVCHTYCTYIVQ